MKENCLVTFVSSVWWSSPSSCESSRCTTVNRKSALLSQHPQAPLVVPNALRCIKIKHIRLVHLDVKLWLLQQQQPGRSSEESGHFGSLGEIGKHSPLLNGSIRGNQWLGIVNVGFKGVEFNGFRCVTLNDAPNKFLLSKLNEQQRSLQFFPSSQSLALCECRMCLNVWIYSKFHLLGEEVCINVPKG